MKKLVLVATTILIMILSTGCKSERPKDETLPSISPPPIEETLPTIGVIPIEEVSTSAEESVAETEPPTTTAEETEPQEVATTVEDSTSKYTFTDMNSRTMYITGTVNVRSLPSTEGEIYFVYHLNDEVWVTGQCNETGWYRVDIEGHTCYISNKYLSAAKQQISKAIPTTSRQTTPSTGFVYYTVAGQCPSREYEQYLYNQLSNLGLSWWYPYAVAQIFQESRWNPNSTNGKDHGICQFKGVYFAGRAKAYAGMNNADIWNPYDSLKVYAYYIKAILAAHGNDVNKTLSFYICGDDSNWNQDYINRVLNWYNQLKA